MGVELTTLAGQDNLPTTGSDHSPDHGDESDDAIMLDELRSHFGDLEDDETPDSEAGPDDSEAGPGEGEGADEDAADAGQGGEEQQEEVSEDEEQAADASEDAAPAAHAGLEEVSSETYEQARAQYEAAKVTVSERLKAQYKPVADAVLTRLDEVDARLAELKTRQNEDGYDTPLTPQDVAVMAELVAERRELTGRAEQVANAYKSAAAEAQRELDVRANMQLWPQLKAYEQEYRQLMAANMDCSNPHVVFAACRALRGEMAPTAKPEPSVPKAEIERQAIQANLERKQRGAITAGVKSAGAVGKPAKVLPDAVKREMEAFSRAFRGEE